MSDMLELLKRMADEVTQPPAGDTGADTRARSNQTRLDQLIADWGKTDSQFDLNADGTVGIRDMLALLAQMVQREPEPSRASRPEADDREQFNRIRNRRHFSRIRHHEAHHQRAAAHYQRAAAHNHAQSMRPQIASMDPNQIRESVQDSNIPTEQKQFVLDRIAAWHPRGHRVSVVG